MDHTKLVAISFWGSIILAILAASTSYLAPATPLIWQICLGLAAVLFLAFVVLEKGSIRSSLSKKTTQYGINAVFMCIVALAIVVFLNLIANRHDIKKDFTKNRLHTLSEQTVKVLKGLPEGVVIKAFVASTQQGEYARPIEKFTNETKNLKLEFVDVDKDPQAVRQYQIRQLGTIVVESGTRTAKIENLAGPDDPKLEEKMTNALIQVAKGEKKKIYVISGHGERLLSDTKREGLSEVKAALESSRFKTDEISLLDKTKIPEDAEILFIASPRANFADHELKMLDAYLKGGGKMMVMLDPDSTPTIKPFLASQGILWNPKKTIVETNPMQQLAGGNPLTPIVTTFDPGHQVTQDVQAAKQPTIFPIATPLEKAATTPPGYTITSLFSTSKISLEVAFEGDRVKVNEKTDKRGPFTLAFAVSAPVAGKTPPAAEDPGHGQPGHKHGENEEEKKGPEMRLIVVGDSDFATNQARNFGMNTDLFQNMVTWLAQEEDLIAIRPKATDDSSLDVTEGRYRTITMASVVVTPLTFLILGIAVWVNRRRK